MTLSLLMTTIGRSTLKHAVKTALASMGLDDELIIVADGPNRAARKILAELLDPRCFYLETPPTRHYGCEQLDFGMERATKDFVMFLGDDDETPLNACMDVRKGIQENLEGPHIFSMKHGTRVLGGKVAYCEVSNQQLVLPNKPYQTKYAHSGYPWGSSDWKFIENVLLEFSPVTPTFHDECISILTHHGNGQMF